MGFSMVKKKNVRTKEELCFYNALHAVFLSGGLVLRRVAHLNVYASAENKITTLKSRETLVKCSATSFHRCMHCCSIQ